MSWSAIGLIVCIGAATGIGNALVAYLTSRWPGALLFPFVNGTMIVLLTVIERRRLLVPVPFWVANIQASILQLLPNPLLTKDQVMQLREHNIVSDEAAKAARTLTGLGIQPQAIATILPSYLWRFRAAGQFQRKPAA